MCSDLPQRTTSLRSLMPQTAPRPCTPAGHPPASLLRPLSPHCPRDTPPPLPRSPRERGAEPGRRVPTPLSGGTAAPHRAGPAERFKPTPLPAAPAGPARFRFRGLPGDAAGDSQARPRGGEPGAAGRLGAGLEEGPEGRERAVRFGRAVRALKAVRKKLLGLRD